MNGVPVRVRVATPEGAADLLPGELELVFALVELAHLAPGWLSATRSGRWTDWAARALRVGRLMAVRLVRPAFGRWQLGW